MEEFESGNFFKDTEYSCYHYCQNAWQGRKKQQKNKCFYCEICKKGLHLVPCFEDYQEKMVDTIKLVLAALTKCTSNLNFVQ